MSEFSFGDEFESFGDDLMGKAYEGKDINMIVTKVEAGVSPKGKRFFRMTLQFDGGPNSGKTVTDSLYWSPENDTAVRIFTQSLNVLGCAPEWVKSAKPSPEQMAERMKGQKVQVNLRKDEFNGQPQTRVTYRKNLSGGQMAAGTTSTTGATSSHTTAVALDDEDAAPATAQVAEAAQANAAAVPAAAAPAEPAAAAAGDPWA